MATPPVIFSTTSTNAVTVNVPSPAPRPEFPRLAKPAFTFDGVDFRKATPATPYWVNRVAENVHLVAGHEAYFGRAVYSKAAKNFHAAWESYLQCYKETPYYAYKPEHPYYTPADFYESYLDKAVSKMNGLVVATVASYSSQIRGAVILKRAGFKLAGDSCTWNPNYREANTGPIHWLHLFYKFQGDAKEAGAYRSHEINCCGAYACSNGLVKTDRQPGQLRLAIFYNGVEPPAEFIPIHKFDDSVVGIIPGKKHQKCPHKFTLKEASQLDDPDGYDENDPNADAD